MMIHATVDCGNTSITYEQQAASAAAVWPGSSGLVLNNWSEIALRLRLHELGNLRSNWDGEGAAALSSLTLHNARDTALKLSRHTELPEITPNSGDTITFEWETDAGMALMEIGHDAYSFLMKTKVGKRSTDMGRLDSDADFEAMGAHIQRALFHQWSAVA